MLHHLKTLLIVVAALVGFATAAHAQELTSPWEGRHFLLAFPDTTTNLRDPINLPPTLDTIALVMYSPKGTHVAITGPSGYQRSVTLPAGEPTEVYLDDKENPATRIINDISGVVTRDVFSVEADDPITLYCWMMTPFGGEAWTPLPVERWGKEYQVISALPHVVYDVVPVGPPDFPWGIAIRKAHSAPVYLTVIAANDGTDVSVISPNRPPGGSKVTELHLDAGECYQLDWSDSGTQGELITIATRSLLEEPSGTMIQASKPIAVIGGASRGRERYTSGAPWINFFDNPAIEWLLPVSGFDTGGVLIAPQRYYFDPRSRWNYPGGTDMIAFFTNPNEGDAAVRIHSSGGVDTMITIQSNEVVKWMYSQSAVVSADKSIQIMSFITGKSHARSNFEYISWGSSSMMCVPRSQWYNEANIYIPDSDSSYHFVTVVADIDDTVHMIREKQDVVVLTWDTIVGSKWKTASVQIDPRTLYQLKSNINNRFIGYIYGSKQGFSTKSSRGAQDTCFGHHYDELSLSYAFPVPGYVRDKLASIEDGNGIRSESVWSSSWLHPNPVRDVVRLSLPFQVSSPLRIDVIDCLGRCVVQTLVDKQTAGDVILDVNDFTVGTYIIRVVTATGAHSMRLVKY